MKNNPQNQIPVYRRLYEPSAIFICKNESEETKMENAERKARQLLEAIMANESIEYGLSATVFSLLSILDPADFVACGYSSELEACLEQYADNMDDDLQKEIMRALKIAP